MTSRESPGSDWLGPLSDGVAIADASTATPGGPRYRLGGEIGVGAMGRVRAAFDTLLERSIAVKQVRTEGDATAERALLREARITARLDHPGIIAVLDVGEDTGGEPFFAMRVVHGRSLAELSDLRPRATATQRTASLREILQVAHAMAYAHSRDVVHRDLSPRNVRVGAHGEVVVMDWGLAAPIEEAARGGVVCGTPGYRAPELERGEPSSPSSDVWSLGALAHFVVIGAPPEHGGVSSKLPAELRSLLARALAVAPADRYPDAGELAADLAAFVDGGRVQAHRDRPWDRPARFGRRHPGVLAAGVAGLTAVAVVAIAFGTLANRRADDARRSRGEARVALRTVLIERAAAAVRSDDRASAQAAAARVRELGARADASGVEASFAASPAVDVRVLAEERGCRTLDIRGHGERLCTAERTLWFVDATGARRALDLGDHEPTTARFLADGGAIVASATDRGNEVVRFDPALKPLQRHHTAGGHPHLDASGPWAIVGATDMVLAVAPDGVAERLVPCPPGTPLRMVAADPAGTPQRAAIVVLCGDGHLVIDRPSGTQRIPVPELLARLPATSVGAVIGGQLVVGGVDGRVGLVTLPTGGVVYAGPSPVGAVRRIVATRDGDALVIGDDGVGWLRPDVGAWRYVVPRSDAVDAGSEGGRAIAFGAGSLLELVRGPGTGTHRISAPAGLASVAWSRDGALVAFGGGSGHIDLLDVHTGQLRRVRVAEQVVTSIAFGVDNHTLALGIAGDEGLRIFDLDTLALRSGPWLDKELRVRRIAYLSPDVVLALRYGLTQVAHDLRARTPFPVEPLANMPVDADAPHVPGVVVVVDSRGDLHRYDAQGHLHGLRAVAGGRAIEVAIAGDGSVVAIARDDGVVEIRDAVTDATRSTLTVPGAAIEDAALAPHGERLALGRIDGTVEVWSTATQELVLRIRSHAGRVAAVAFSPDGCSLATAGWDEIAHVLALCQR